jgi:hypothetical protein
VGGGRNPGSAARCACGEWDEKDMGPGSAAGAGRGHGKNLAAWLAWDDAGEGKPGSNILVTTRVAVLDLFSVM